MYFSNIASNYIIYNDLVTNISVVDLYSRKMSGSCGIVSPPSYKNKRAEKGEAYEPTHYEHIANTVSHAIAIVPSIIAFYHIHHAASSDPFRSFLMLLYGFFTTLLFSSSTCYHFCELKYREKKKNPEIRYYLHICDRASIYLFIAASYTPWLCLRDCGMVGYRIEILVWLLAFAGIVYQYNFHERYKTLETVIYIIIAAGPSVAIFSMADRSGLSLMQYGGLVYLTGVIFFKMDGIIPFAHAIWHIFVVVGACIHTYAVYSVLIVAGKAPEMDQIRDVPGHTEL